MQIKILVVDDQRLICESIARTLADFEGIRIVGGAQDARQALAMAAEHRPHVVLLDVRMPDVSGPEVARRLLADDPALRIVMLTISDKAEDLDASIRAGAQGYLLKSISAAELVSAIHAVHRGRVVLPAGTSRRSAHGDEGDDDASSPSAAASEPLTDRERDVLRLLAWGLSNKSIALRLGISVNTVRTHLRHLFAKLGVENRAQAAAYAVSIGLARHTAVKDG